MTVLDLLLTLSPSLLFVPLTVLTVECLAALLPARRSTDGPRPCCAVLVPAHDEEAGLSIDPRRHLASTRTGRSIARRRR